MLLLTMFFPLVTFSQYPDTELGHDGFMGPVKSAKITAYQVENEDGKVANGAVSNYQIRSYTESGRLENMTDYNADGTINRTQEYTFDEDGNLVELIDRMGETIIKKEVYNYDVAGNLVEKLTYKGDGTIDRKLSNIYSNKSLLIESSDYSNSFDELILNEKKKFEYDNDGNKVKESYVGPEGENWGSAAWTYNASGKVIEWVNLTETDEIKIRQTYLYNDDQILITRNSFNKNGDLISEVNLDPMGQPLSLIRYDKDGSVIRKSGNRYDQFGNNTTELKYGPDGTESVYAEYEYTYDNKNNWIRQIGYQGGEAAYIIGREITYY